MEIKDLKEKHPRIYKRALECQVEQGNEENDEMYLGSGVSSGNFYWDKTKENESIWHDVNDGNFDSWYNFHGNEFPRKMLVWDKEEKDAVNRLVLGMFNGFPIVVLKFNESEYKNGKYFNSLTYRHCKEIEEIEKTEEMTIEEVCKELGRNIKIVK